jgi:hypothetical protein
VRTTVNIDDRLLEWAKDVAREREVTLGDLRDEALRRLLTQPLHDDGPPLPVFKPKVPGLLPGIDPDSNRSLFDAADDTSDVLR